jgi:threonine dehydratase
MTSANASLSPVPPAHPTRADIDAAAQAIAPHARRTPIIEIPGETLGLDVTLVFKLEYLQVTGAFKARGALNYVATQPISPTGLVAASGGNHGAAVAYAAQRFHHDAHIFVPTTANPAKVERLIDLQAHVHSVGATYPEALEASLAYLAEHDATSIAAFDDPVVMAGAGTVAREFDLQTREAGGLDAMLVAVGGGGLAGGSAVWCGDRIPVVGCETVGTASYAAALEAGAPVPVPISGVAADHLGATIGAVPWAAMRAANVESVVVTDDDVLAAQSRLWRLLRVVVEPGVAAPMAALLTGRWKPDPGARIGVVLCGANVVVPWGSRPVPAS